MQLEDQVRQVQAGNVDAFEDVVRQCERPIRSWIVARCPAAGDADEVAQKTFVEAFKNIDQYQPGTDFIAWLFSIARFQLMAECTRLKRLTDYHSRYVPHALSRELERRAEQVAGEPGRLVHLQECLKELGDQPRRILDWRYKHKMPLAKIAERTERSVGAIKKHLFKLRRQLHNCIERKQTGEVA